MTTLADLRYRIQHTGDECPRAARSLLLHGHGCALCTGPEGMGFVKMPTNVEMLTALAEAERPCPCPCNTRPQEGGWHKSICECKGTGRVPRFPVLREECGGYPEQGDADSYEPVNRCTRGADCKCQGRCWVPIEENVAAVRVCDELFKSLDVLEFRRFLERIWNLLYEGRPMLTATLAAVLVVEKEEP